MVRINAITRGVTDATVLVKLETFNPGNSIKDRMAVRMIEDAERSGALKPGGTIIEGTSGNTGMGLAIAAVVKGYRCIFTTTDKQSKEKIDALKAFGAEVIVCPTDVDPEDPASYYSVSSRSSGRSRMRGKRTSTTTCRTCRRTTSRRRRRSGRRPTVASRTGERCRTGGTASGIGRYLKERKPRRSRCGASTPTARSSRSTRRPDLR
jgi:cystathionine beta-synthase